VQAPDPKEKYQNVSTLERAPAARVLPPQCAYYFLHDCAESLRRRASRIVWMRGKSAMCATTRPSPWGSRG